MGFLISGRYSSHHPYVRKFRSWGAALVGADESAAGPSHGDQFLDAGFHRLCGKIINRIWHEMCGI